MTPAIRVTRDSDLEVDGDDITNLRQALRRGLTTRHFGRAIRLEVVKTCPSDLSDFLLRHFDLPEVALYKVNGPVRSSRAGRCSNCRATRRCSNNFAGAM